MTYYSEVESDDNAPLNASNPAREAELHMRISTLSYLLGKSYALSASCADSFTDGQEVLFNDLTSRIEEIFYRENKNVK
jgi:hypothetical protein